MEKLSDYRPLTGEQHKKINMLWGIYRSDVVLDYDLIIEFKSHGVQADKIPDAIRIYRENTADNLKAWHELRQENS